MERWFHRAETALQKERLERLEPLIENALLARHTSVITPGADKHTAIVALLVQTMLAGGVRHGQSEMMHKGLRRGHTRFNIVKPDEPSGPLPLDAIEWIAQRVALQGRWQRDLDSLVTQVLVRALQTGATLQETMKALRDVFPEFSKARLENIARTEASAAYTQGRLAAFRANKMCAAVQFAAILDGRTTSICRERDGLVLMLDDDRLIANTPPLHYQCRSTLVPVDKYDLEDLQAGDSAVIHEFFGWVKDGPKDWQQAQARWDSVPPPLAGFGGKL